MRPPVQSMGSVSYAAGVPAASLRDSEVSLVFRSFPGALRLVTRCRPLPVMTETDSAHRSPIQCRVVLPRSIPIILTIVHSHPAAQTIRSNDETVQKDDNPEQIK